MNPCAPAEKKSLEVNIYNEIQTHQVLNHRKVNSGYAITSRGGIIYWSLEQLTLFSIAEGNRK